MQNESSFPDRILFPHYLTLPGENVVGCIICRGQIFAYTFCGSVMSGKGRAYTYIYEKEKGGGQRTEMNTYDIRNKEVINIYDGRSLGFVEDVELNLEKGTIEAIIIPAELGIHGTFFRRGRIWLSAGAISSASGMMSYSWIFPESGTVSISTRQETEMSDTNEGYITVCRRRIPDAESGGSSEAGRPEKQS